MTYNSTSLVGIAGIEQESLNEYEAPNTIIQTVGAAQAIYQTLRVEHLPRMQLYAEIDGLIDGNPPYSPSDLKKAGLDHIANFNDMSADAVYARACLAYWNLLYSTEYMTKFAITLKDSQGYVVPDAGKHAVIMARNWDRAMKKHWKSFYINLAVLSSQLVKLGVSPIMFYSEEDPRWRSIELNRFFVPNQAQSDLDLLTTVCLDSDFTVQYLWDIYQQAIAQPETPTATPTGEPHKGQRGPWNVEALGTLLIHLSNSALRETTVVTDFVEIQRMISDRDATFQQIFSDTVRIVSIFQQEYDGSFSHYMFHRFSVGLTTQESFIFFEKGQYKKLTDGLILYTMHPGSRTIHGNKGIGHKMFSLAQAKIMLDCAAVDLAKWASTPIIKSPSLNSKDVESIRFFPGVPTNIGAADFVDNTMGANIRNVVDVAQYVSNLLQFNLTYSGADAGQPDADNGSKSPSEVKLLAYREYNVLKNNVSHFYATSDLLIQNMTGRMFHATETTDGSEIGLYWKKLCIEDGVPEELFDTKGIDDGVLPEYIEVVAARAAGAGSQYAVLLSLQEIAPIMGGMSAREEKLIRSMYYRAAFGAEHVEEFMQESDRADEAAGGSSLAQVENNSMQQGMGVVFSQDNDQRAHFMTHSALAKFVIQGVQQQEMDVIAADKILSVLVPHVSEHFQALSSNPFTASFVAQNKDDYNALVRYATLNRKNAVRSLQSKVKQEQDQAEQQRQVLSDEELKTMQVLNEEQRKDVKLAAQNERQVKAGTAKEQALDRKTTSDIGNEKRKTDATVAATRAKSDGPSISDAEDNPTDYLQSLNEDTLAPYDIE